MADHPHAKKLTTIAGFVIFGLVLLAMMFGMGDWRQLPPATAEAPVAPSTVTR